MQSLLWFTPKVWPECVADQLVRKAIMWLGISCLWPLWNCSLLKLFISLFARLLPVAQSVSLPKDNNLQTETEARSRCKVPVRHNAKHSHWCWIWEFGKSKPTCILALPLGHVYPRLAATTTAHILTATMFRSHNFQVDVPVFGIHSLFRHAISQ